MSRKREGLVDLLRWSRRPSTCDQSGARKDDRREERPLTALQDGLPVPPATSPGRPHTSLGLSGRVSPGQANSSGGQLAHSTSIQNRNTNLPPLSKSVSNVSNTSSPIVANPPSDESMSHFQEALYVNGQPHNSTSRLLRLGTGVTGSLSIIRRSVVNSPSQSSIPPLSPSAIQPPRNNSPTAPNPPTLPGFSSGTPTASHEPSGSPKPSQSSLSGYLPSPTTVTGAQTLVVSSSPPRAINTLRIGSREYCTMMEEARRLATQAAEVLYNTDPDVTPADRSAASQALDQLEAVLGAREVALLKLGQEAKNLRAEVGRELHASDKQASFARAQLRALERQHERLRQQLRPRPRPDPLTVPSPNASGITEVTPALNGNTVSPKLPHLEAPGVVLTLRRTLSGTISAPHSPCVLRSAAESPTHWVNTSSSPGVLHGLPSPGASVAAYGAVSSCIASGETDASGASGAAGGGGSGSAAGLTIAGSPSFSASGEAAAAAATPGGASAGAAGGGPLGGVSLLDRWNLAGAMERTLQLRALSRAEAAMAAVAAAHPVAELRPKLSASSGHDVLPGVDVEELRRLKHAPTALAPIEPPSYLGVVVRRTTSPLPNGDASGGPPNPAANPNDPRFSLQWSNRGISTSKMPLLREMLLTGPQLVRLCLAGNKLANEDVCELMSLLSDPAAPHIEDLSLDQNTNLTWRCALPLALALGMAPDMAAAAAAADWAAVTAAVPATASAAPTTVIAPPATPSAADKVRRLNLRRLSLAGVKLGDKGVAQLAEGLRSNSTLRDLNLRRCGLSDPGGAVLMEVLESNGSLTRLDVSWNALRNETARALAGALAGNAGLRELGLAHNGFGDVDGARVVKGLLGHGKWLSVDLSHNGLGPGSCMMVGELLRRLGDIAGGLLQQGTYAEAWPPPPPAPPPPTHTPPLTQRGLAVSGLYLWADSTTAPPRGQGEPSPPASPSSVRISAGQLGAQLREGQPALALDGNPLGSTGLRILLDAMEAAGQTMLSAGGCSLPDPIRLVEPSEEGPPLPLYVSIANCNVAPPSERNSSPEGGDDANANPFLPSIAVLCRPTGPDGKPIPNTGKKPAGGANSGNGAGAAAAGGEKGAGKDAKAAPRPGSKQGNSRSAAAPPPAPAPHALNLHSPHLDLHSPAGQYTLDLSHPGTAVLVAHLLRLRERLAEAVEAGRGAGLALQLTGINVNGRTTKVDQLAGVLEAGGEGTLQLTVKAPAVLALQSPRPLTPCVADWLAGLLAEPTTSPLWKLSVVQAAGSVCFFTPVQCLALLSGFDRDTQAAECVAAAQMLYARSAQPLAFWEHVMPRLTGVQQQTLKERVGDLVALDMNRPMGRYTLNLSRQVDRFVALRLQLASALECSWTENKYFINWLNASFNGQVLDRPGLTRIRDYTLPGAGVLRLDYVSYQKPGLGLAPASDVDVQQLLAALRGCTSSQIAALVQVRSQVQPPPPDPPPTVRREGARSPVGRRARPSAPPPPPPPKPRLTAFQLMHMTLREVAQALSTPPPPPPQPTNYAPSPASLPRAYLTSTILPTPLSSTSVTLPGTTSPPLPPPPSPPQPWYACAQGLEPEPLLRRVGLWTAPDVGPDGALGSPDLQQPSFSNQQLPEANPSVGAIMRTMSMGRALSRSVTNRQRGVRQRPARGEERGEEQPTWEQMQAEYYAGLLLLVFSASDLPLLASKMTPTQLASAASALLRMEGGLRALLALLVALPPLAASKFLYDQADPSPCLLPPEIRKPLVKALPADRAKWIEAAARGAREAGVQRARRVRTVLNLWASQRFVTAEQVVAVLGELHTEADRVTAMAVLWPRLVDGRWKKTYLKLSLSEQRQVMLRLGFLHVYTCLADPHGIYFALDLTEPEQRDIARELVRMAVKETMRAKQEAKGRAGQAVQTLLDLHGNGNPVSIPEDEKLWGMADSNFKTMEFLYSPTFEQSLERAGASAQFIQRFWMNVRARRAQRVTMAVDGGPSLAASTSDLVPSTSGG